MLTIDIRYLTYPPKKYNTIRLTTERLVSYSATTFPFLVFDRGTMNLGNIDVTNLGSSFSKIGLKSRLNHLIPQPFKFLTISSRGVPSHRQHPG